MLADIPRGNIDQLLFWIFSLFQDVGRLYFINKNNVKFNLLNNYIFINQVIYLVVYIITFLTYSWSFKTNLNNQNYLHFGAPSEYG